jgi:signal transduction histidine kinase
MSVDRRRWVDRSWTHALAAVVGVALICAGVVLGAVQVSDRRQAVEHTLSTAVDREVEALNGYFDNARTIMLLTAHNPAYESFYRTPGDRLSRVVAGGSVVDGANDSLAYLQQVYPESIGEACFIDRSGAENARVVNGFRARPDELSPDESVNPFFAPTFARDTGHVYQAAPYVSPDTGEWVISNSTPVPSSDGVTHAIVHYEITLESFRRVAADAAGDYDIKVVDAGTGGVVLASDVPQLIGAPLGDPDDDRFASLAGDGTDSGSLDTAGLHSVYMRLPRTDDNANNWYVVATAGSAVSPLAEIGPAPLVVGAVGLALLVAGLVRMRGTRQRLTTSAAERRRVLDQTVRGAEEERSRLARELHDGPIQRLTALDLKLERMRLKAERGDAEAGRQLLGDVSEGLRDEIQGLRRVMSQLRPPALDERGLEAALTDYVQAAATEWGLRYSVQADLPTRLDPTTETVLYRVAQEGVQNVVKHARATTVALSVAATNGTTSMWIRDDGVGFDGGQAPPDDHLGLIAMRERVEMGGGTLRVRSAPGSGTEILVQVPTNGVGA